MTDKKKEKKPPIVQVVQGNDAVIRVNMFLPEMEPTAFVINIKNLKGRATYSQRDAQHVASAIIAGLTKKFGKL